MCLLEVVTGDIPWAKRLIPVFVKFQVKKGRSPALPESLSEKQQNLLKLMMRPDPLQRVMMAFVVDKIFDIATEEEEKSAANAVP